MNAADKSYSPGYNTAHWPSGLRSADHSLPAGSLKVPYPVSWSQSQSFPASVTGHLLQPYPHIQEERQAGKLMKKAVFDTSTRTTSKAQDNKRNGAMTMFKSNLQKRQTTETKVVSGCLGQWEVGRSSKISGETVEFYEYSNHQCTVQFKWAGTF